MAITKEYLESVNFEIAKQKYYNANKVDAKLEELKQGVLELIEENERLRKSCENVSTARDDIGDAFLIAQTQSKQTIDEAKAQATRIVADAHGEAAAITQVAQTEGLKIVQDAKDEALRIITGANKKANEMTEQAKKEVERYSTEEFSLRQLEAIEKVVKQLDDLNVTHATQVLRLKQSLMKMATDKE